MRFHLTVDSRATDCMWLVNCRRATFLLQHCWCCEVWKCINKVCNNICLWLQDKLKAKFMHETCIRTKYLFTTVINNSYLLYKSAKLLFNGVLNFDERANEGLLVREPVRSNSKTAFAYRYWRAKILFPRWGSKTLFHISLFRIYYM